MLSADNRSSQAAGIDDVVADYLERVDRGESVDREAYLRAYPALADELRAFFSHEVAVGFASDEPTVGVAGERTAAGRLNISCPHCHESTSLEADTAVTDVTCSCCGNHFSLVNRREATRTAQKLATMGRFELVERLGVGGFGAVWKARDEELKRTVAVKVPRMQHLDADGVERFMREARAAARLRHPNIVAVHEVGREGDTTYIVSDYVKGVTLSEWRQCQAPTFRQAAELMAKIADALHYAHERGVVHRDLKPSNIMIDGAGEPNVLDFGLARLEAGDVTMTMESQILGTPAYMSPEQAAGDAHLADRRSDVYSLGAILFELLAGERPFRGNEQMLRHQAINVEPPSPRTLNSSVPKDLETITLKCLEKAPERRFATALELGDDLRRFLHGEPIQSRPIRRTARAWRRIKKAPALSGFVATLTALLLVLGVGGPLVASREVELRRQADEKRREAEALSEGNLQLVDEQSREKARTEQWLQRVSYQLRLLRGKYPTNLVFIIDASASTAQFVRNPRSPPGDLHPLEYPLLDVFKYTYDAFLGHVEMSRNFRVGLMFMGHRAGWDKKGDHYSIKRKVSAPSDLVPSVDAELILPLSPVTPEKRQEFFALFKDVTPFGETPLFYAISQAAKILSAEDRGAQWRIVCFTDGIVDIAPDPDDSRPVITLDDVLRQCRRARIRVDFLRVLDSEHVADRNSIEDHSDDEIKQIATATGGIVFESKLDTLADVLENLGMTFGMDFSPPVITPIFVRRTAEGDLLARATVLDAQTGVLSVEVASSLAPEHTVTATNANGDDWECVVDVEDAWKPIDRQSLLDDETSTTVYFRATNFAGLSSSTSYP